jgi:hypothetical protein
MSGIWFYEEDGKTLCPASFEKLVFYLARQSEWRSVLVWRKGFADWKQAVEVDELSRQFTRPPRLHANLTASVPRFFGPQAPTSEPVKASSSINSNAARRLPSCQWGKNMKVIFAFLLAALPLVPVQAQQENTITLSCDGAGKFTRAADDVKPDPIKGLGIVVSASQRTVSFHTYTVPIKSITNVVVTFNGRSGPTEIDGTIDRVSGRVSVDFWETNFKNNSNWELRCHPATRLF